MKPTDTWCLWINGTPTRGTGPVALMQAATKEAGMVVAKPRKGDTYFDQLSHKWDTWRISYPSNVYCLVIPAPEPEPFPIHETTTSEDRRPCPNCQNVKPGKRVEFRTNAIAFPAFCVLCGRPESKWTYAPDIEWGGIGSGIM